MKVIISHPTSNQFNRAAVKGLLEEDLLFEFHTAIASFPGSFLNQFSGLKPLSDLKRRGFDRELTRLTRTWPWLEAGRIFASRMGMKKLTSHETGLFCLDAVYRKQDERISYRIKRAAIKGINAVYGYEDGALFSFREAKKQGLLCFYDLPIGYWRTAQRLLSIEKDKWPEWAPTITGLQDSEEKLRRKDEELGLADHIFVASSFTANTLKEYFGALAPVEVIPYGFPDVVPKRNYVSVQGGRPLKLLFVGGLSQRKGIADLFAVVDQLQPYVSLTVVGNKAGGHCPPLDAALAKHRWIPTLPHADILKLMQAHDVLVFPSLFEGFGMVITEAMSQGTPVITTDRTAGPDLLRHGQNGWLMEAGSTLALQSAIEELLIHPRLVASAGKEAMETARQRPWNLYGKELAEAIRRHQFKKS